VRRLAIASAVAALSSMAPAAWAEEGTAGSASRSEAEPGSATTLAIERAVPVSFASREEDALLLTPAIPKRRSLGGRVVDNLTLIGDGLGLHVSALTADLVRFDFDFAKKHGRFKVGGGTGDSFLLRVDGDVRVHGSVARITSRVDLGLAGEQFSFQLPDVDLATQSVQGERAVELRLPLLEGKF
jgi:hypothetical protein